jgi:hypothetical protein
MFYVARTQVKAAQTLVVASNGSGPYLRIGQAMSAAQPGDTVRVEPGEYAERVVVADGVDLVARVPGSVTITRPADLPASVPSLVAGGGSVARIFGIKVMAGDVADATAISLVGAGAALEMVEIGRHRRAVEMAPGSALAMHGSRVGVGGELVTVPDTSQASLTNNIFVRSGGTTDAPIAAGGTSRLTLTGNVFSGFDPEIIRGLSPARRVELLTGNTVVPPPPPTAPARGRGNRR